MDTREFGRSHPPSQRRPVAWYSPRVLWQAAQELVQSQNLLRNLDRRESFSSVLEPIDLSGRSASEVRGFWFDFISDTGDGGNATFAVAQAALRRSLTVADRARGDDSDDSDDSKAELTLPEGELLVLGGDLAYPGAGPADYQYRFHEMFALARDPASRFGTDLPAVARAGVATVAERRKVVAALPQNHDWFDSAATFCRYFVNYDRGAFIGARTPQRQTYFALALPRRWWVLGFDWALSGDLDRNQFEAFVDLAKVHLAAGDDLILVYPEPYWTRELGDGAARGYPRRYQRLEAILEARGARIRLRLAGDLHHYKRETLARDEVTGLDTHLVTCGSGGAFLHPTHGAVVGQATRLDRANELDAVDTELQSRVRVGRVERARDDGHESTRDNPHDGVPDTCFQATATYPDADVTRRLAWRNLFALFHIGFSRPPLQLGLRRAVAETMDSNFAFALYLGLLYGINAYVNSFVFSRSFEPDGFAPMQTLGFAQATPLWLRAMVFSPVATLINICMLAGCIKVASEGPAPWATRIAGGVLHGMAHGYCVFVLYWCVTHALAPLMPEATSASLHWGLASWALVGVAGVLVGALLFGVYLMLMSAVFGQLPNNAFGSLAVQDYKGFMRFCITEQGLEATMLGLDQVPRSQAEGTPPARWRVVDRFMLRRR